MNDIQKEFILAEVRSMIILLDQRLPDENPWASVDLASATVPDLVSAKKLLHELLYSPPIRS
jgi:hypothetical protein